MKKFLLLIIMLIMLVLTGCTVVTNVTVAFDSNGGSVVGAIVVKKGGTVEEPTPPTKEDCDFLGWYLNDEIFDFSTPINESITLKAEWQSNIENIYSVIFFDYDGTVLRIDKVKEGEAARAPKDPTREGYEFIGWSVPFDNVKEDLNVVAQYESLIKYYTVIFKDYDGTVLKTETVLKNTSATPPKDPTREGYIFSGWDVAYDKVTSDLEITAKYIEQGKQTFTVTFKDDSGKVLKEETVEEGKGATAPTPPTKQGYTFIGWDVKFDNVKSDLVVIAQYEKIIIKYKVTFKDYDDSVLKEELVIEGENATAPTPPERVGYTFTGWDKSYYNVQDDLVVTAQYEKYIVTYKVVFKDYDGTVLKEETVEEGKAATAPKEPTREGFIFIGWSKEFNKVTSNLEITAQYKSDVSYVYTISYELNGGAWGYLSKEDFTLSFLTDFYKFVKPEEDFNTFVYGDSGNEYLGSWKNYVGGYVGDSNMLLYENDLTADNEDYFFNSSEYKEKWSVLGTYVKDYICGSNKRFGYEASGYYYGALDFYRYVINDPASYIDIYTEAFWDYPSVNQPSLFSYTVSSEDIELPIPLNESFNGWYLNSDFSGNPITAIPANSTGDLVLYAAWDTTITYEILFNSDGGTEIDPITVEYNQIVTLPTNLSKVDCKFLGWKLNGVLVNNPFTYSYRYSIVLTAAWQSTKVGLEDLSYNGSTVKYRNSNTVVQIPTAYVQPEAQLRAAWVTSYAGNFSPSPNESTMKNNLQEILDVFDEYKLNCMIFHIRTTNNAFYPTDLAPINSEYGTLESFAQWDYLEWLIDECHKRGIEFHAWLNPYRIKAYGYDSSWTSDDVAATYSDYPKNPASKGKNILMTYRSDGTKGAILDPYETEVQDYIVDVCLEVMEKYNVDAIHFDDYFYAQMSSNISVLTEPDQADYEKFIDENPSCGYSKSSSNNKKQWRRDNIDKFIKKLHDAMTQFNIENGRGVQLGISPTGIYRNGNGNVSSGSNTSGQEHYSSYLFCDTKKWVDNEWIEYIMPQTYWAFTHSVAGYADVIDWWNKVVDGKNVNLYSGLGIYMSIGGGNYSWGTQPYEITNQVLYTTKLKNVKGVSLYSYGSVNEIRFSSAYTAYKGLQKLKNEYWTTKVPTPTTAASQYIK